MIIIIIIIIIIITGGLMSLCICIVTVRLTPYFRAICLNGDVDSLTGVIGQMWKERILVRPMWEEKQLMRQL